MDPHVLGCPAKSKPGIGHASRREVGKRSESLTCPPSRLLLAISELDRIRVLLKEIDSLQGSFREGACGFPNIISISRRKPLLGIFDPCLVGARLYFAEQSPPLCLVHCSFK